MRASVWRDCLALSGVLITAEVHRVILIKMDCRFTVTYMYAVLKKNKQKAGDVGLLRIELPVD